MASRNSSFRSSWLFWAAIAIVAAGVGGLAARLLDRPITLSSGTWLPSSRPVAAFELVDQQQRRFQRDGLLGQPSLVFFGFTNCPDVCPTTLAVLAEVARQKPLEGMRIVFVSVDTERDTPLALSRYLSAFGGDLIGLTGSPSALQPLLDSLSVAATRQELPDGNYTMDHSAAVYLLDSSANFVAVFTPPLDARRLAADLRLVADRVGRRP